MKRSRLFSGRGWLAMGLPVVVCILLTGCQTPADDPFSAQSPEEPVITGAGALGSPSVNTNVGVFTVGDIVTVNFSGNIDSIPTHEERIPEDGRITLPLIGPVVAAGKTAAELQKVVHDLYVPRYYRRLTVTVVPKDLVFYVGGEVRREGPAAYIGGTTLTKAIQTAGGFTDFANKKRIQLTRGGTTATYDWNKIQQNPSLDPLIIPGDSINVRRRWP
ncbi:MAG: SLBB domain-containing protein [Verrucomicrobiae bacterium]|nr:SLBB domain-containing protein [Verrucomicrobiae bacterium]